MEEREEGDAHNIYALSVPIAELRKGKKKVENEGLLAIRLFKQGPDSNPIFLQLANL